MAWPKKASGSPPTSRSRDVQGIGLEAGLVDNKSAAIGDVFQGLQFVIRVKDRPRAEPGGGGGSRRSATPAVPSAGCLRCCASSIGRSWPVLAVGLIAGALRFTHLGYPQQRIFDEYYYSKSACIYLGYSNDRCDVNSSDERYWRENRNDTGAWVHPPLGKWMIAAGELAVGTDSYGWRVSSAVTGTATVMLLAVIVQLLFGSPLWTFVGGLLLAVESLNFVQSRTAMLDIFVTFWIVLGFVFLLLDRRWIDRRTPEPPPTTAPSRRRRPRRSEPSEVATPELGTSGAPIPPPPDEIGRRARPARVPAPIWRPWRFAAGVALGAGWRRSGRRRRRSRASCSCRSCGR